MQKQKPEGRKWDAPRARSANRIGLSGFFKPQKADIEILK